MTEDQSRIEATINALRGQVANACFTVAQMEGEIAVLKLRIEQLTQKKNAEEAPRNDA